MKQIVGCALVPHPPLIIPEIGRRNLERVEKTRQGMERISVQIREWQPETVILITPHGPVFHDAVGIAAVPDLQGDFASFGKPNIRISAKTDQAMIEIIEKQAGQFGIPVLRITENVASKHGLSVGLDHGALVPLYYLAQAGVETKIVHISIGWLTYEDLFVFGQAVQEAVKKTDRRTVVVCSGDLSHRLTPDAPAGYSKRAREFDEKIVDALSRLDVEAIRSLDAALIKEAGECGLRPIYILLGVLDGLDVVADILSYEGPFGVGYAVIQFQIEGKRASKEDLHAMMGENSYANLARRSLEHYVLTGRMLELPECLTPELNKRAGVFVSLKKQRKLRGCIGTFAPTKDSIAEEIIANAVSAGVADPRFFPVKADELNDLEYSVDVLSDLKPVQNIQQLDPKKYGIILRKGHRSGLLLPDLDGVDTVEAQISIAKQKAGIRPEEQVEIYKFTVTRYK